MYRLLVLTFAFCFERIRLFLLTKLCVYHTYTLILTLMRCVRNLRKRVSRMSTDSSLSHDNFDGSLRSNSLRHTHTHTDKSKTREGERLLRKAAVKTTVVESLCSATPRIHRSPGSSSLVNFKRWKKQKKYVLDIFFVYLPIILSTLILLTNKHFTING